MRRDGRLPDDQAEIVFSDVFVEQLEALETGQQLDVLADVVGLCEAPGGKHPLSNVLAGWNTIDVLAGDRRVVFKASTVAGIGIVEVLCIGPRANNEVYDIAVALVDSGALTGDEATQIFQALELLGVIEEAVGLDGWDFRPPAPDEGFVKAVVAAGLLDLDTASLLARDELEAAMTHGWGPDGPNQTAALTAALKRARSRADYPGLSAVLRRRNDRCAALMPRAGVACIRTKGHPGPHRST